MQAGRSRGHAPRGRRSSARRPAGAPPPRRGRRAASGYTAGLPFQQSQLNDALERVRAARAVPARRRRVRTPLLLQLTQTECGAACLGIVLAHFGRWVSIEELRETCFVGRDGCNAADVYRAARRYGLEPKGWRRQPKDLLRLPLPMILYWEFRHFVVLEGFRKGRFLINDPANGHRTVSEEEFDRAFTGLTLTFRPGPDFRPGGIRPGILQRILPWLRGVRKPLAFATCCGLLLALPSLALPFLVGLFVDAVLSGRQPSWGGTLIGVLLAAAGLIYLLTWLRERCLRRLSVRLSVEHAERFMTRLLRLPMRFFSHRFAGDLTSRIQLLDSVAAVATRHFAGIFIELVTSVAFLGLMLAYDPLLCGLVVALGALGAAAMRVLARARVDENRRLRREQGMLHGIGAAGLGRIDVLQATAAEDDFFTRWTGHQARELLARQRFAELGCANAALPVLVLITGNAAVLGLGGWRVISGDMTVGMLTGFYMAAAQFLQPIGRFIQLADVFQMLEADLHRLDDVFDAPEDRAFDRVADAAPGQLSALAGRLRLKGRIELRNVTFGYQENRAPLIEDFSLTVEPGQRVAIVGPSGSGKSTLSALVAGIHRPWSGEILIDGRPRDAIPRDLLTSSVSLVDQHVFLFADTVRDNLTMWIPEVPDEILVAAAQDASIHDEIISRPLGYDAPVEEGGRNFSGGQRQRLEIARALVNDPSVLVLDEATSALDALTEVRIDDALRRRGCACLIVAHRLSTIRDCDLIVVLDRGREVQRGSHEELLRDAGGLYRQLVESGGTGERRET